MIEQEQNEREVYMDYAATSPVKSEVLSLMYPYFSEKFGNPSSAHKKGNEASLAIKEAREKITKEFGGVANQVVFTSGGTEADNLTIRGLIINSFHKHIITSKIEHPAVLQTIKQLEEYYGCKATYLDVDKYGKVNPQDVKKAIRENTGLISIMYANNEIGTIQPIHEIGEIAREYGIPFHTDAVQAIGNIKINIKKDNIAALSLSGHKIGAPKGIGALIFSPEHEFSFGQIMPQITGGEQEYGLRSGTENVPSIVGLGEAVRLTYADFDNKINKLQILQKTFCSKILSRTSGISITGTTNIDERLQNNIHLTIDNVNSETLLLMLNLHGISASIGSACNSQSIEISHVLKAIGFTNEDKKGFIRFTINETTTLEDIEYVVNTLIECVESLKKMS